MNEATAKRVEATKLSNLQKELDRLQGKQQGRAAKYLRVKFWAPKAMRPKIFMLRAGNGRCIIPGHELSVIETVIENVEKAHPHDDFSLVQISPKDFNIVWRGRKPLDAEEPEQFEVAGIPLGQVTTVTLGQQP